MVFEDLHPDVREAIEKKGWDEPTVVQEKASPSILAGEDTLVMGPTGYGKTESSMLPIFSMWAEERYEPTSVLYITPLRALNRDIFQRVLWWANQIGMEVAVRHGDTTQYQRKKQADFPPHMFVTTPETLQAILTAPKLRPALAKVKWVVIDEIHELVENKRGTQLSIGLERLRELAGDFQTVGLSATVGSPEDVAEFLKPGAKIANAMAAKDLELEVRSPTPTKEDEKAAQKLFTSPEVAARLRLIEELVSGHDSSLVFTNTRASAEVLSSRLEKMDKDWTHGVHHSSLSKDVRVEAEDSFKEEEVKSLICTSSLELGIDIGSIDLVIQHMSPRQVSKLLQRVGRSGHKAGELSKGIIITNDEDDILESAVVARRALAGELEETEIYPMPLDVLANQIVGMAIEEYDLIDENVYKTVKRAYPYREMSREVFDAILSYVEDLRMVWNDRVTDEGALIHRRRKAWKYYYKNLSTIPDVYQYEVVNNLDGSRVGVLDEAFVAEHGEMGTSFIVKGSPWRILSVDDGEILVEPAEDIGSAVPAWEGELMPVPFEVAQEVGALRRRIAELLDDGSTSDVVHAVRDEYPLDEEAATKLVSYIEEHVESGKPLPDDRTVVLEDKPDDDFVILHTCYGTMVNATLARFFAVLLSSQRGHSIAIKNDPYRIVFRGIDKGAVEELIGNSDTGDVRDVVLKTLDYTKMFRWRMLHVAKRFGALRRRAQWDKMNMRKLVESFEDTPVFEEAMNEVLFEKLDMENAERLFHELYNGDAEFVVSDGVSPIGKSGIEYHFRELIGPKRPEKEIFQVFKERLLSTRLVLMCMKCADYRVTKTVSEVDEEPVCPVCESRVLAVFKPRDREAPKLIEKNAAGKEIPDDKRKEFKRLEDSADLVLTYGRRAIVCLAGHGVGPDTAIRVMAKQREDEEGMLKDVLEAERQFAKTKKYWN